MNTTVWLNRRHAVPRELPAIERAIAGERERDMRVLAGVLTAEPVPLYAGRTVDVIPSAP